MTVRSVSPSWYTILSRQMFGHHVHWLGANSQPCTRPKGGCDHCKAGLPIRYKGYLHCLDERSNFKQVFLCFPPGCAWEMMDKEPEDYNWRGRRLSLHRQNKSAASLLVWHWDLLTTVHEALPEELDPSKFLDTVFRRKQKPLDTPQ